jgi:plastocyanin
MRVLKQWVVAGILTLTARSCFADAIIEGHVALPKERTATVVVKRYEVVSKGGIVSIIPPVAVVYLDGTFPRPASPVTAQMAQKNLAFVPALLPIQVGTKVEFPNQDNTYHNIFSYSAPKRFDLGRYGPDDRPIPSQVFDAPGLETLRCDIHEHMRAIILVLATPYFVTSGTDGHFKLSGLPAGHYTLKAWVNSTTTMERAVDLQDGSTLHMDLP